MKRGEMTKVERCALRRAAGTNAWGIYVPHTGRKDRHFSEFRNVQEVGVSGYVGLSALLEEA